MPAAALAQTPVPSAPAAIAAQSVTPAAINPASEPDLAAQADAASPVDVTAQADASVQADVTAQAVARAEAGTAPAPQGTAEDQVTATPERWLRVAGTLELGTLAPLWHTITLSRDGTRFDYRADGGQDNLFFFARLTAEARLGPRHALVFLYQPLDLRSAVRLERDLRVDGALFPAGAALDLRYGFSFYRASYLYNFWAADDWPAGGSAASDDWAAADELALGASLQIRNATIDFTTADGSLRRTNRDIGPVPALKGRWRQALSPDLWLGAEVDGVWAPIKYFNGSDNAVEGAIIDASLRAGTPVAPGLDAFINLRWIAGGATGQSEPDGPSDGYVSNWLHFATLSLGLLWRA